MKKIHNCILGIFFSSIWGIQSQSELPEKKEIPITQLDEITIISRRKLSNYQQEKIVSGIDQYLENSLHINMIKRGNYAWEPSLNNMTTDRLSITIDGMQIYGACTDKMDPVTSYVDVSNLEKVTVYSGQEGAENTNTIGGGIDLTLPEATYKNRGFKSSFDLGYETNSHYKTTGTALSYSGNNFFVSGDIIYRKSDNYYAGNNNEVLFSQFEKYNISVLTAYKISEYQSIEVTYIYDRASDVGYPALPMDVSLAKASIASLAYKYQNDDTMIKDWETKLYYNSVTHIMDDTKRPDVPIRMDMPGWSDTYGGYSKMVLKKEQHSLQFNLTAHYNRSLAEMTMYPNTPDEQHMFMYTWPDVRTFNTGFFAKDKIELTDTDKLHLTTRIGYHKNTIKNQTGLESLRIFYPFISDSKQRILNSFSANYQKKTATADLSFGIGYGERAPSVSEGYGFFLFNSFDGYDYIGNPALKKEKSVDFSVKANFEKKKLKISAEAAYFHLMDYIIGEINPAISPMTIGANGVRVYNSLAYASIFKSILNSTYTLSDQISLYTAIGFNYGQGSNGANLPLISPLSYQIQVSYKLPTFNAAIQLKGNVEQTSYSPTYGEDKTPSFAILNLTMGNQFYIKEHETVLKYGIENILDTTYSTYADWNNIPRQGRNFFVNLSYILQ